MPRPLGDIRPYRPRPPGATLCLDPAPNPAPAQRIRPGPDDNRSGAATLPYALLRPLPRSRPAHPAPEPQRRPAERYAVSRLLAVLLAVVLLASTLAPALSQSVQTGTVTRNANLRAGPGTTYAVRGSARAGSPVRIVDTTAAGDWYELDSGQWIAAFLVRLDATPTTPAVQRVPAGAVAAQVVSVTDGDTIRVRLDGGTYPLRYILVNTPESDEPLGAEATAANRRLVEGQTVYLLQDVSETDRYGRLLRYVFLADGTHVGAELVRQGFAQLSSFPPDIARAAEIQAAQQEAMTAGRGLWASAPAPTPGGRSGNAVPMATPTPVPAAAEPASAPAVALIIIANHNSEEILEIRNLGAAPLDLGGWRLDGSKGDDYCVVPGGTTLAPGAGYQVATGESQPQGAGFKCGDGPIWNNTGETIYLRGPAGVVVEIESVRR